MISYRCFFYFFALSLLVLTTSCVSDIDTDRVDEIVLSPRVDADLVFFTLNAANFQAAPNVGSQIVIRDTTRLEFINDAIVQESLKELSFMYQSESTLSQNVVNKSLFLDQSGRVQYELNYPINGSLDGEVVRNSFEVILSEEDIARIKNSIQVVNEITLFLNGQPINGQYSLQSKAIYALEISDF